MTVAEVTPSPLYVYQSYRHDPTRTGPIRAAYEKEFVRRIKVVKRVVRIAIAVRDVLGLDAAGLRTFTVGPPGYRQFAGLSPAEKIAQFGEWLRNLVDDAVIEGQDLLGPPGDGNWQRTFIRQAYLRGAMTTITELQKAGRDVGDQTAS